MRALADLLLPCTVGAEAEELLWGRPSVTTKKDSDDRSTPSDKTDVEGQHGRPKLEWQWL